MPLIHDIQSELLNEEKDVGSTLLKLKVLASKLEADVLEDWVTHEIEGYPADAPVPDYRKAPVTYQGNFMGSGWHFPSASIPSALIANYAGKKWAVHEIIESLSVIDWQMKDKGDKTLGIDASELKFRLRDKEIYQGMGLTEITATIHDGAFIKVQQTVRAKALDLVLKIEKEIPSVVNIDIGGEGAKVSATESEAASNIAQQIIYANSVTNINATGDGNVLQVGAENSFVRALTEKGIDEKDAEELARIAQENPETLDEKGIANWVGEKIKQGAGWAKGMGKDAATAIIVEIVKKSLGF